MINPSPSHHTIDFADVAPSTISRFVQREATAIEGNLFGVVCELRQGRIAVATAVTHDAQHDRYLAAATDAITGGLHRLDLSHDARLLLQGVRQLIALAQRADALEDAEIAAADGRMASAQDESRQGAGRIEMLLVGRERA